MRVCRRASVVALSLVTLAFVGLTSVGHTHHSYVTKYDPKKSTTIKGVISSVSYTNPHIFFSVQTSGGTWRVETEGIPKARARGLTSALLKSGARVRVSGWRARSGGGALGMRSITFLGKKRTITMRRTPR